MSAAGRSGGLGSRRPPWLPCQCCPCCCCCRELRHHSKAAFQIFTYTSPLFTGGADIAAATPAPSCGSLVPAICNCRCPAALLLLLLKCFKPRALHFQTSPCHAVSFIGVRSFIAPPVVGWFVYTLWFRWALRLLAGTGAVRTPGFALLPASHLLTLLRCCYCWLCRSVGLPTAWRVTMGSCVTLGMIASQVHRRSRALPSRTPSVAATCS